MKFGNGWQRSTLGEIADATGGAIQTGPFGSQLHQGDYSAEGVPVVMPKDIVSGRISDASIARIPVDIANRLARHRLAVGDIVYGRRGDIGRQALITERERGWICGTGCLRVTLGDTLVDPHFIHYYLSLPAVVRWISNHAIGATLPNLNTSILRSVAVSYPSLDEQRRIARALAAYDDLIENNERRMRLVEAMVRALYCEWFIELRYPGHENVPLVESAVGRVPSGWTTAEIESLAQQPNGVQTGPFGSQLHQEDYTAEGVAVVMPKDLRGFRIDEADIARIPESIADRLGRHRLAAGDIVYGRRGDIGRRAFVMDHQVGMLCGTGCLRIRPDPHAIDGWYLFHYLGREDVVALIAGRAQGVTMPNLNTKLLATVPVVVPPRAVQNAFRRLTFPLALARESLIESVRNLLAMRALLLPRLLSGELSVENAA